MHYIEATIKIRYLSGYTEAQYWVYTDEGGWTHAELDEDGNPIINDLQDFVKIEPGHPTYGEKEIKVGS